MQCRSFILQVVDPFFPMVVLRGHISPCPYLYLWFRCVGTRKPVRQAVHEGFISLSLSDKSIILCFYAFDCLRKYAGSFGSLDDSSPLLLQFSSLEAEIAVFLLRTQF
jgi:hypothetical protein